MQTGQYENVALLDVESQHPHRIKVLNVFSEYTQRFVDILDAWLAIKHGDYVKAKGMLDGQLAEFLNDEEDAEKLSKALKIVINSAYGCNVENIIAKHGSLFMFTLKYEVQKSGYTVTHIKTDSIKISNADEEIISFLRSLLRTMAIHLNMRQLTRRCIL